MKGSKKNGRREKQFYKGIPRRLYKVILRAAGGKLPYRESVQTNLSLIHTGNDVTGELDDYYISQISLILKILAGGIVLTLLIFISERGSSVLTDGYYLARGEETYSQDLTLITEDEGESELTVEVEPRRLTSDESAALLESVVDDMESYILGENTSLDDVRSDLDLIDEIEGTPITVEWDMDTYEVLSLDGSLRLENLTEEGTVVNLTATLTCNDEVMIYQTAANVFPPVLTAGEEWMETVSEAVAASQEASSEQELLALPASIGGISVSWEEEKSSAVILMPLLTVICAALIFIASSHDLEKKVAERERQMERDYARIVSKLVLLTGAGATIRTAWETISNDYLSKRESGQEPFRYAFEEMVISCREMDTGVAESKAYENFGLRCRLPCYLKLSALLEQNLKKGSKGLNSLLTAEIADAFEQRRASAVRQGEEASTKLLVPMMLLLVVVVILIMVPAAMSMQM